MGRARRSARAASVPKPLHNTIALSVRKTIQTSERPREESPILLAIRADAEKFKAMRDALETGRAGDFLFEVGRKTVGDLNDFRADSANQVMMMIVAIRHEFEARCAVAEIKAMNHAHFF